MFEGTQVIVQVFNRSSNFCYHLLRVRFTSILLLVLLLFGKWLGAELNNLVGESLLLYITLIILSSLAKIIEYIFYLDLALDSFSYLAARLIVKKAQLYVNFYKVLHYI